jgi:hypothetical protein
LRRPWRPPAGFTVDGRLLLLSLGLNGSHPSGDQWIGLEGTPSRGKIHKESLRFYEIEPVVLGALSEIRFFVLKAYFFSLNQKIRFLIFTVLPLNLFWS